MVINGRKLVIILIISCTLFGFIAGCGRSDYIEASNSLEIETTTFAIADTADERIQTSEKSKETITDLTTMSITHVPEKTAAEADSPSDTYTSHEVSEESITQSKADESLTKAVTQESTTAPRAKSTMQATTAEPTTQPATQATTTVESTTQSATQAITTAEPTTAPTTQETIAVSTTQETTTVTPTPTTELKLSETQMAKEIFKYLNQYRVDNGRKPFNSGEPKMWEAAQIRANEILILFDHWRPNDRTWNDVLYEVGIGEDYSLASECLSDCSPWQTHEYIAYFWDRSASHKHVILQEDHTTAAIGFIRKSDGGQLTVLIMTNDKNQ